MAFQFTLNAIRFEDIRAEIVRFLTERGEYDAQFDFEGSNLAYVIDTMAYTTMLMSYMLSTIANDNFLDTTTLRKNAVSIAKTLGYKPKRIQASRIEGIFTYSPGDVVFNSKSKITIPANTVFSGKDKGQFWVNTEPIVLKVDPKDPYTLTSAADETKPRITLIQGIFKQFSALGTGESLQTIDIPSKNIDENNMRVSVYTTQNDPSTAVEWTYAKTFFDIKDQNIYFVEENILNEGTPKIIFGNGIVGRPPANTETILVDYLETVGEEGNGESDIEIPSDIVLNKSFDISTINVSALNFVPSSVSFGGEPYETLEGIKANAPRFFATAGRGVTANDIKTLIENEFSHLINKVVIIGGDELSGGNREFLGNSYIAATPANPNDGKSFTSSTQIYLTETVENEITSKIKDSGIIATQKFFLKLSYIYLDITPTVEVNESISETELRELQDTIDVNIQDFVDTEFDGFKKKFRESKIRSQIDSFDQVLSSELNINYGFILNKDTFYISKDTEIWLPVRYKKNDNGIVETNDQGYPITVNFLKKNETVLEDYNNGAESDVELFRITLDSNNVPTIETKTYVWHNKDIYSELDTYWKPSLQYVTFDGTVDFGNAFSIPTDFVSGDIISLTLKNKSNVENTFSVLISQDGTTADGTTIIDTTTVAGLFVSAVNSFNDYSATTVGDKLIISGNESFTISTTGQTKIMDGTAVFIQPSFPSLNITVNEPEKILRVWELYINDKNVAYLLLNTDKTFDILTIDSETDFLKDIVEIKSNFEIEDANILQGRNYTSVLAKRIFNKYNLLPEEIDEVVTGKTTIFGKLTHKDLNRYIYNNDVFLANFSEVFVYENAGSKYLIYDTFGFKGQGNNYYTASISFSSVDSSNNNIYSIYLNNSYNDERQKVATMIWDKSKTDESQFSFIIQSSEAEWLINNGFEVKDIGDSTTGSIYEAITVKVDENNKYIFNLTLSSEISSIKLFEKERLLAFEYSKDGTAYFNVASNKLKAFENELNEKVELETREDIVGELTVSWNSIDIFKVVEDTTDFTKLKVEILDGNAINDLGLRTEFKVEPYKFVDSNGITKEGYVVYAYGIYHNTVLGLFEYETGYVKFNKIVEGNKTGGNVINKSLIHIRNLFDNYDEVKMDVITLLPDNKYEIINNKEIVIGKLTDFDMIFTQTMRANVQPITVNLI